VAYNNQKNVVFRTSLTGLSVFLSNSIAIIYSRENSSAKREVQSSKGYREKEREKWAVSGTSTSHFCAI
jgi:hypothetical protein